VRSKISFGHKREDSENIYGIWYCFRGGGHSLGFSLNRAHESIQISMIGIFPFFLCYPINDNETIFSGCFSQVPTPTMVTPSGPWKASAKRRRWILKRYGRGPRKKPPEPPPSPAKRTTGNRTAQPKLRPSTRTSRRINYQCIRQTTIHPQFIYRATAPFLSGRRRSYRHISNRYWRAAKASILRTTTAMVTFVGFTTRSLRKHLTYQDTSPKQFTPLETVLNQPHYG
jgi:hypothetical protein